MTDAREADESETELVMAMPRRELYAVRGFCTQVSLAVLESLQEEHWFARSDAVDADLDAKEVRIALLVRRGDQWLVDESGILLHAAAVSPTVAAFGAGLAGLKGLARAAGGELVGSAQVGITLHGYVNEDRLEETRPFFILVYILTVADNLAAPEGMTWVSGRHLGDLTLDPPSLLVLEACGDA